MGKKIYKSLKEIFPDSEIVIMSKKEKEWWDKNNPFTSKIIFDAKGVERNGRI